MPTPMNIGTRYPANNIFVPVYMCFYEKFKMRTKARLATGENIKVANNKEIYYGVFHINIFREVFFLG